MKRILLYFSLAILASACSTEETQIDSLESTDITKMEAQEFQDYMEDKAISQGLIPGMINPDASVYPFDIASIEAFDDMSKNFGFGNPAGGVCLTSQAGNSDGEILMFNIEKKIGNGVADESDHSAQQGTKFEYEFEIEEPGWYIHSIYMNIDGDCNALPTGSNGLVNVCGFNIRNCFRPRVTKVTYTFADSCLPECSCNSVYVVAYKLDQNNNVIDTDGLWLDGDNHDAIQATSNTFCKSQCGNGFGFED
ncbi:hypothetical protein [Nonlabens xiamenensis]|uniref:hypothetical protein n=1 Tax=Nonlabens xiamenensis TaxID=2341043 RepID=UPI000F60A2F0|nr:hypothetical protein [Nonlabens xiamenensis]